MQVLVSTLENATICIECDQKTTVSQFLQKVSVVVRIPPESFTLSNFAGSTKLRYSEFDRDCGKLVEHISCDELSLLQMEMSVCGGIDFQHREGSKIGSGGQMSESQAALERKERLRKLAVETIDITKDPYIIRNNLGTFECKLCLTVHPNEGNYLAHTQGKRHQYNLGRRAAMEAKNAGPRAMTAAKEAPKRNVLKIGRPGYKVNYGFGTVFVCSHS